MLLLYILSCGLGLRTHLDIGTSSSLPETTNGQKYHVDLLNRMSVSKMLTAKYAEKKYRRASTKQRLNQSAASPIPVTNQ